MAFKGVLFYLVLKSFRVQALSLLYDISKMTKTSILIVILRIYSSGFLFGGPFSSLNSYITQVINFF